LIVLVSLVDDVNTSLNAIGLLVTRSVLLKTETVATFLQRFSECLTLRLDSLADGFGGVEQDRLSRMQATERIDTPSTISLAVPFVLLSATVNLSRV
jgi:hypothetical protein